VREAVIETGPLSLRPFLSNFSFKQPKKKVRFPSFVDFRDPEVSSGRLLQMRTMPLEHMVAPRGESHLAKRRVMGASVAALLSGALLVVVCVALLSQVSFSFPAGVPSPSTLSPLPLSSTFSHTSPWYQSPSQRRSIELESEQGILAAAERRGFEAGEREEAKRQLRLQELGRNGHLAKGQKFEGLVDTTGADFGSGVVSGKMIRSLIGCQKFKKAEFIKTCYENKMGHDRSFKSASKQMLTGSPPPKSWPSAQSLAAPVTPSEVISPEVFFRTFQTTFPPRSLFPLMFTSSQPRPTPQTPFHPSLSLSLVTRRTSLYSPISSLSHSTQCTTDFPPNHAHSKWAILGILNPHFGDCCRHRRLPRSKT
jgi:hypothetical protein